MSGGYTEARKRATKNYFETNNLCEIKVRMTKDRRAQIKEHAACNGESLNTFCIRAIDRLIEEEARQEGKYNEISSETGGPQL